MKSLVVILKALGVKITEADIRMLEELIPQIPAHLQAAANTINSNVTKFDIRLQAIEQSLQEIRFVLVEKDYLPSKDYDPSTHP